ncbi:MAG TPA: serine/threonine-protein kinase [Vampirovibrionales bacterium]
MAWQPGEKLLNGKYTIKSQLGQGGFGITYLARDDRDRPFAIKTLGRKARFIQELAKYKEEFLKEADCLSRCIHPSIVRLEEVIDTESLCCIVLEYIDGTPLAQLVKQKGRLSEREALFYTYQIADALSLVHQQGFLHRDVKPMNIVLRKERSDAVLIDFGLAQEFSQDGVEIHPKQGSRGFAPLEQYDLRALRGAYTDVYGLAATLYALLTAKVPASASSRDRSWVKTQTDPLIPPQTLNQTVSDRVNTAILKGLALVPENRPQSIEAWLELLSDGPGDLSPESANLTLAIPEIASSLSAVGMDYTTLETLLAAGQWQEADRETDALMLRVAGREAEGRLNIEDVKHFPCRDLRTLDRLWTEYSNGHFGWSIQRQIWSKIPDDYEQLSDRVGWRRDNEWVSYGDLTFDITAPVGHLPSWGRRGRLWSFLATRLKKCSL